MINKKHIFLLFCYILIIITLVQYNYVYGDVQTQNNFQIYLNPNAKCNFQLLGNLSKYLTINVVTGNINSTQSSLVVNNVRGILVFNPTENGSLRLLFDMSEVKVIGLNNYPLYSSINNNTQFNFYENIQVGILYRMNLVDETTYSVTVKAGMGIFTILGIILAPFIATWFGHDLGAKIFILMMIWTFFGMFFYVWIYML